MTDSHHITNFDELAITPVRSDALSILQAGYRAIDTERVLKSQIFADGDILHIQEHTYDLSRYERVFFIGIGKCAFHAGCFIESVLGKNLTGGIIVDVEGSTLGKLTCIIGTHPLPSPKNVRASQSVADMLEEATEKDLILALISGGGSALLCLPNDLQCEKISEITSTLMKGGATIEEVNTVRKHTSKIQGGQFVQMAYPAKVVSLIFSDVPNNDISVIASGPTVMDKTTVMDAARIMTKYGIETKCELPHCELIETPKEEKYFDTVDNFLLLTNQTALESMANMARSLGYVAEIKDTHMQGEARVIGEQLACQNMPSNTCFLYGGETTVTVNGEGGKGGRNQEVVLGALSHIHDNRVVISAASDGYDNTSAAGALGDMVLYKEAKSRNVDGKNYLMNNASYDFFDKVGGHIFTGKTGSNVADFFITIIK